MNAQKQPDKESDWQKTPFVNLLRYKPSQVYFARLKIKGKLIRRSLKTNQITVAKLRLADLEKVERQKVHSAGAVANGKMTFGDALAVFQNTIAGKSQRQTQNAGVLQISDYRLIEVMAGAGR